MKLHRRGFFGLMGGAAVAGPSVGKTAASMTISDLNPNVGSQTIGVSHSLDSRSLDPIANAKQSLKQLLWSKTRFDHEVSNVQVFSLDENVASLRSVALTSKMRMSKPAIVRKSLRQQESYLTGVIKGFYNGTAY